jgi:peptidoglycan hydrolase-like protein with peptidoglycan-binding domain
LADRGYYKGTVNGEWGDDSVEAMRHFQADRKLDEDGKITALSLIGLGLGPVHDGRSGHNVEAPVPSPAAEVPAGEVPSGDTPAPEQTSSAAEHAPE